MHTNSYKLTLKLRHNLPQSDILKPDRVRISVDTCRERADSVNLIQITSRNRGSPLSTSPLRRGAGFPEQRERERERERERKIEISPLNLHLSLERFRCMLWSPIERLVPILSPPSLPPNVWISPSSASDWSSCEITREARMVRHSLR